MRTLKTVLLFILLLAPASLAGGLTFHGHQAPQVLQRFLGDPMERVNSILHTSLPTGSTGLVFLGVNLLLLWNSALIVLLLRSYRRHRTLVAELESKDQLCDSLSFDLEQRIERQRGVREQAKL